MKCKIARHQEYITINPKEYVLDSKNEVIIFNSVKEAKEYLVKKGLKNFEGIYFEKLKGGKQEII